MLLAALLAADVLLARAQRHHERALAVEVGGQAHEPARDLADERLGRTRGCPGTGPPYWGAMPSGWPSPAAMSAPYAPGGARTARETGSMTATNSAPAAWASARDVAPSARGARRSSAGASDDPGDRSVGVGEQPLERGEVGRAGGVAIGQQRASPRARGPPAEVRREGLAVVADGRRATRAPARGRVARQAIRAASAVAAPPS